MLKNISSVISPDLLWLLASMGHGDDLVLVDRNFPAIQVAKQTSTGRLIEFPGLNIPQATRAILSLMPLDHFVEGDIVKCCVSERGASLLNDWLGGLLGLFFAIDELNADDDLGDEFKALESTPMLLGFQGEFKDHRQGRDP